MASVRVEGFPAPDAKMIMEAMEDDESEKLVEVVCVPGGERSVGNSHDELELELELVGDIQLAGDDELRWAELINSVSTSFWPDSNPGGSKFAFLVQV